jgi:hypothetical protein
MTSMKLNNSNDIVANSVQLVVGSSLINVGDYLGNSVTYEDLALKADRSAVYNISTMNTLLAAKASAGSSYTIAQSDANLALKANVLTTYSKQDVTMFLAEKASQNQVSDISDLLTSSINTFDTYKADKSSTYTKTEVNGLLTSSTGYTKAEDDALLLLKADKTTTYTISAMDTLLTGKTATGVSYTEAEADTLLTGKAASGASYLKTEMDSALATKAPQSSTYTKTETDTLLTGKTATGVAYTKAEDDALLLLKADKTTTYTISAMDTLLTGKTATGVAYTKAECDTLLATKGSTNYAYTKNACDALLNAKQATLSNTVAIAVSTLSCTSLTTTSLLSAITCSGDMSIAGALAIIGNVSSARFTSGSRARFYNQLTGSVNSGVLSHENILQFAISASVPPLTSEVYMTMDTSGVTVAKALIASSGLSVTGYISATATLSCTSGCYVGGGLYHSNNYFGSASGGNRFYHPNPTTPTTWESRIQLGSASSTAEALWLMGGIAGIRLFQCPADGGAIITQFDSSTKKLRHFGNITTETGGSVSASTFTTLSDARVKTNIVPVDLSECERLVKTISPKGYERTDYTSGRKMGYIAQDWHNEINNDFTSVVTEYDDSDSDGNNQRILYAIDTLPIIATLHGALKVALNKIEQLEARVAMLEHVF